MRRNSWMQAWSSGSMPEAVGGLLAYGIKSVDEILTP